MPHVVIFLILAAVQSECRYALLKLPAATCGVGATYTFLDGSSVKTPKTKRPKLKYLMQTFKIPLRMNSFLSLVCDLIFVVLFFLTQFLDLLFYGNRFTCKLEKKQGCVYRSFASSFLFIPLYTYCGWDEDSHSSFRQSSLIQRSNFFQLFEDAEKVQLGIDSFQQSSFYL